MPTTKPEVAAYLESLPPEKRAVMEQVRDVILQHLPEGYAESVSHGMLTYGIPLERYPVTYNREPLGYAALAANRNQYSLHLMGAYMDPAFDSRIRAAFAQAGKKLDMGKSCIRFRKVDDLPLEAIGEAIASTSVDRHIQNYEASRSRAG